MSGINWGDTRVEWVALGDIHRDQAVNTRPVDKHWVERKAVDGFDPTKFGMPTVSLRQGGKLPEQEYVWLDGQNRGALARECGMTDDTKIQVVVFRGLTRAQEAKIFLGLNDGRAVMSIYKFLGQVAAQDPEAVDIMRILNSHRWQVCTSTNSPAAATAVTAYQWIYRLDGRGGVLDAVTAAVTAAWGHRSDAMRAVLVRGIAGVIVQYGEALNLARLKERLAAYPGGAGSLYADAKGLHGFRGGSVAAAVSEVVVNAYNKGLRGKSKIEEWQ